MPEATSKSRTNAVNPNRAQTDARQTRRGLLGGLAALASIPAALTSAGPAMARSPDADLLRLCVAM